MPRLKLPGQKTRRQFMVFCLVGASGVLVNMLAFESARSLLPPTLSPWLARYLAVGIGWTLSVASNFVLNDRLTFSAKPGDRPEQIQPTQTDFHHTRWHRLWRYYVGALAGLGLQAAVLTLALWVLPPTLTLQWRERLGNLAGIGVGTVANFVMMRLWVFRHRSPHPS